MAINPSTLYRSMDQLEHSVGAVLILRDAGAIRLTRAGVAFHPHAERLVRSSHRIEETMAAIARGKSSVLWLGLNGVAAQSPSVSAAIARSRESLPDLEILPVALRSQQQLERIGSGELDVGLAYFAQTRPALAHHTLASERFVLVVPTAHRLAHARSCRIADLAGESFLFQRRTGGGDIHDRLLAACAIAGFHPRIVAEFLAEDDQMMMVAGGMGISFALSGAMTRQSGHAVCFVDVGDLSVSLDLDLVWDPREKHPAIDRLVASFSAKWPKDVMRSAPPDR